jgi:hypothetical protein
MNFYTIGNLAMHMWVQWWWQMLPGAREPRQTGSAERS